MATMIRFSHFQLYLTCLLTLSCNALRISRSVACIGRTAVSFRPNVVLKTLCTPAANGLYSTSSSLQLKGDTSKGIIKADLQLDTNVKAHRRNGEVFTRNPTKRPNTKNAMSQQWITLPPCEPKNAYLNLDYNYLSTTSFATIRHQWKNEDANKLRQGSTATVKGRVGDEFLTKWWQAATKWGLLTGKLKTYYETHFISSKVEAGAGTPPEGEHYYTEIDAEATVFTAKDKSAIDAKIHTLSTCVELSIPISAIPNIPSEEPPAPKGESQELLNDIWAGRISRVLSRHIAQLRHSLEHIAASNKIEEVDAITTYFRNISVSEKLELEVLNKKTKLENEPSYNSKMGRKVKYNATSSGKGFGSAKRDNTVLDVSQLMGKMMEKNEKLALERRQQQWKNALNVHNDGTTVREEKISSSTAKWNSTSTVSPSSEQSVPLSVPAGQRTPNRVRDIIATDINTTQPGAITATDSQNKAAAIVDAPAAAAPVSVPAPGQLQRAGQVPLDVLHEVCRSHIARVICIGDVHGCVVEVCDLLRKVEYAPGDQVLFLGTVFH